MPKLVNPCPIFTPPDRIGFRSGFRPRLTQTTALAGSGNRKPPDPSLRAAALSDFADIAMGIVNPAAQPVIVFCRKDPMQREEAGGVGETGGLPVAPAKAGAQSLALDAGVATPEPRLREDDGRSSSATTISTQDLMQRERTGPLRNGNPRGNANLAPRCGARTRRTGCPCRAPAMRNGRCRMHGGKSTGPRTEEGRARIRAARTRHGRYSAEGRAFQSNITGLLRRSRELLRLARQPGAVDTKALRHLLPPEFCKHPIHRETAVERGTLSAPPMRQRLVPPPAPRPQPGGERAANGHPRIPVPGHPAPTRQAAATSSTPPPRRPILLARPTPRTP
jgi:hypothetical protein